MLIGEHKHTVDPKKRVSLPAKFRKEMGKEVVLGIGLDKCLSVYTVAEWEKYSARLSEMSMLQSDKRSFNRLIMGSASLVEVDSLGRILISDVLKEYAGIKEKVAIIGVRSNLEIWDEDAWNDYKGKVEKNADVLAEKLGEIGAF
ncbi:MAG: Protein MraZ [Parcubacteria group bacterium GW2011_GWF2_38_76]|nr:MAG: Protein MraZ [Parcubacteria group bacterium GW2011_GWF2_38_76]HBM46082.1 division/cell wall cluster transcriptional repressor MraZ [Patescibacteria group bacterium]